MGVKQKRKQYPEMAKKLAKGIRPRDVLIEAGYSETQASKGWAAVPDGVKLLLPAKGKRLMNLGSLIHKRGGSLSAGGWWTTSSRAKMAERCPRRFLALTRSSICGSRNFSRARHYQRPAIGHRPQGGNTECSGGRPMTPMHSETAQIVTQRKEGNWTITEWSDGAKTFSLPTSCVEEIRTYQQNQTVELPQSRREWGTRAQVSMPCHAFPAGNVEPSRHYLWEKKYLPFIY